MEKIKASKRDMAKNYKIIGIGYCKAQHLLKGIDPIAYSVGVYGWACDYYQFENVVISTGYSYINSKNVFIDYKTIERYENKARALWGENKPYHETKRKVNKLLLKMVKKATTPKQESKGQ
jgi:hypothetical protein